MRPPVLLPGGTILILLAALLAGRMGAERVVAATEEAPGDGRPVATSVGVGDGPHAGPGTGWGPGEGRVHSRHAPARPRDRAGVAARGPVEGPVSSPFGWRQHPVSGRTRHHDGVDLAVPLGTPVRSVAPGRVRAVERRRGYGLVVEIDHTTGLGRRPVRTLYAHLSAADSQLRPGAPVGRGQAIGASGGVPDRDGVSTGPHLHFEVRDPSGQPLDPGRLVRTFATGSSGRWAPTRPRAVAAMVVGGRPNRAAPVVSDTVDIWPAAEPGLPKADRLPDLVLPEYPSADNASAPVGRAPTAEPDGPAPTVAAPASGSALGDQPTPPAPS